MVLRWNHKICSRIVWYARKNFNRLVSSIISEATFARHPALAESPMTYFRLLYDQDCSLSHVPALSPCPYTALLRKCPNLTNVIRTRDSPPHDVVHHIRTTGPASFSRYRRLDPTTKRIAQTKFEHMMKLGIVCPIACSSHLAPTTLRL